MTTTERMGPHEQEFWAELEAKGPRLTALPRSEQRRKNHQVKVRLDDDDLAGLDRLCKANGITGPELLRLGLHRFLNEENLHG